MKKGYRRRIVRMITCPHCGATNDEDANFCVSCGASLSAVNRWDRDEDECFGLSERSMEDKCFSFPNNGAIIGVLFGLFIILIGISIAYDFNIWRWIGPSILIIIGLLIIVSIIRRRLR
jgi:uncharacterized integral membrane protein